MKNFFLFLLIGCLMSCGKNRETPREVEPELAKLSDSLEIQTQRKVNLLPEAQEKVSNWLEFATALNQVEDMKQTTGRELVSNSQPVVQIMEALNNSLPDSLKEVPVRARTTVLVTKAHVLHQAATKKEIRAGEVFDAANDIILEFDNFKLQLNELFLKTPADFELELDRQFKEGQDSLRNLRELENENSQRLQSRE